MADDTLRAAVIGAGLGGYHAYAYDRSRRYHLAAVCDIDPGVMPRFYERSEVPAGSIGEYTDYRLMLEREHLDVVSVATPDHLHADAVCHASEAGVRGILCEKPLATTLAGRRPHDRRRGGPTAPACRSTTPAAGSRATSRCGRPCATAPSAP